MVMMQMLFSESLLSHRQTLDVIILLHTKKGIYLVKSGYHVARQLQKIN